MKKRTPQKSSNPFDDLKRAIQANKEAAELELQNIKRLEKQLSMQADEKRKSSAARFASLPAEKKARLIKIAEDLIRNTIFYDSEPVAAWQQKLQQEGKIIWRNKLADFCNNHQQ